MIPTRLPFTASVQNLQRVAMMRLIVLLCLTAAILYAYYQLSYSINYSALSLILLVLATSIALTLWRCFKHWPVTEAEFFAQILFDIVGVSALLYYTGGASNPFVSYYLVPLTISAALLPWRYSWIVAGLSLLAYSLLLFYHQPFIDVSPHHQHQQVTSAINLHIIGMWLNFAFSALLITFFVVRMASTVRLKEQQLATLREDELRDEQLLAVATLAAGTAHELGTPLSTMAILLEELEQEQQNDSLKQDIALLQQQVYSCKSILQGLVKTARSHASGEPLSIPVDQCLQDVLTRWQVLRPQAQYQLNVFPNTEAPTVKVDSALEQAITNLLNNAADASPERIDISLSWDNAKINLTIRDHGPGIAPQLVDQLGKPYVSTKGGGLGLGLFLTHTTIARHGGTVKLYNVSDGGAVAELTLPINQQAHD